MGGGFRLRFVGGEGAGGIQSLGLCPDTEAAMRSGACDDVSRGPGHIGAMRELGSSVTRLFGTAGSMEVTQVRIAAFLVP